MVLPMGLIPTEVLYIKTTNIDIYINITKSNLESGDLRKVSAVHETLALI